MQKNKLLNLHFHSKLIILIGLVSFSLFDLKTALGGSISASLSANRVQEGEPVQLNIEITGSVDGSVYLPEIDGVTIAGKASLVSILLSMEEPSEATLIAIRSLLKVLVNLRFLPSKPKSTVSKKEQPL